MTESEFKEITTKILDLEQKCQNGENVSENVKKIEEIMTHLSISDLFELSRYLEEESWNFKKFLI